MRTTSPCFQTSHCKTNLVYIKTREMLSLKRGLRYVNIVRNTKSPLMENITNRLFISRQFSGVKPNEIVISEVKNMATVAVKWYDEHDLEHQIDFLKKLRDLEPIQRNENVHNFIQVRNRLSSMWLGNWICKASTDKNFKLFPLSVPMEDKDLTIGIRNDLAATIFSIKTIQNSTVGSSNSSGITGTDNQITGLSPDITKQWHSEAIELSNQLADSININRLRKVGTVFQDYIDEQIPLAVLYRELLEVTGYYANELIPILNYTELSIAQDIEYKFHNSIVRRNHIQAVLTEELSHIIHIINSKLFFGEDSPIPDDLSLLNTADTTNTTNNNIVQNITNMMSDMQDTELTLANEKKNKKTRKPKKSKSTAVITKNEKENNKEAILENTNKNCIIYTRKLNNFHLKLKYDDNKEAKKQLYIFDANASCFRTGGGINLDDDDKDKESNQSEDEEQEEHQPLEGYEVYSSSASSSSSSSSSGMENRPQYKVMIENLPPHITENQLRMALRKCGEIDRIWIHRDERTTPGDFKHLRRFRRNSYIKTTSDSSGGLEEEEEGNTEVVEGGTGSTAGAPYDAADEAVFLSKEEQRAFEQTLQKMTHKQKLLRSSLVTDNYAFVTMKDEDGHKKITQDAVRLFGLQIEGKTCRVYPTAGFKSFIVEVNQQLNVREAVGFLNALMKGQYECYAAPKHDDYRPVFIHLSFENAIDSWNAYETLLNSLNEINNDALVLTRRRDEKPPNKSIIVHVNWLKTQWYKEHFNTASAAQEKHDYLRSLEIANRNNLKDYIQKNIPSATSVTNTTSATTATSSTTATTATTTSASTTTTKVLQNNTSIRTAGTDSIDKYDMSALGGIDEQTDYGSLSFTDSLSDEIMQYFEKTTKKSKHAASSSSSSSNSRTKSSAFLNALNLATKRKQSNKK